jgi:hypothetical protein
MPTPQFDPSEFWQEPSESVDTGDVFLDVPLLSLRDQAAKDEADQIYLPTRRANPALLLKALPATWWFVPILTRQTFADKGLFDDHLEQCTWGNRPGWFVLPALDAYPPLSGFSLVFTMRPTIHHPDAFEDAETMRVASLTSAAYEGVCNAFIEGFTAP